MAQHASHKDIFLQSLERCTSSKEFIPAFYRRFLAASDEIREKFKHTDFEKQNKMLVRSLKLAAGATAGEANSLQELRDRAETHDRHHLDIKPELYDHWRDAIIAAANEFDPKWNDETKDAWHSVLGYVINHMTKYY